MENNKKLTFGKKLKNSIFDFEKYQDLAAEKISRTLGYVIILVLIIALTVAGIFTYKFSVAIANVRSYIDENIESISFSENLLNVIPKNHEETAVIKNEQMGVSIIINTQNDEQKIKESIDELNNEENGILILNDKILIKNEMMTKPYAYSYKALAESYNINVIDKKEALSLLSYQTIKPLLFTIFGMLFIYFFVVMYLPSTLIDILVLSLFGYLVSMISKMKLKYSAVYNIAAYSLTLPMILNLLYIIINSFTGFTIQYFEVMYTTVATIYIAAAILLIRSDLIKKQIELTKIIEEQDRVRAELQRKEEEEKEQDEREKQKKEDEEKQRRKEKEEEKGNIGNEPEGNNV